MIVLDTHVWIWWLGDPNRLSPAARECIEAEVAREPVRISSISTWELALLVARDRLALTMDVGTWVQRTEQLPEVRFVPVDNAIAVRSVALREPLHADPADRIIIATALGLGATIVTKDERIRGYPHVETLW